MERLAPALRQRWGFSVDLIIYWLLLANVRGTLKLRSWMVRPTQERTPLAEARKWTGMSVGKEKAPRQRTSTRQHGARRVEQMGAEPLRGGAVLRPLPGLPSEAEPEGPIPGWTRDEPAV